MRAQNRNWTEIDQALGDSLTGKVLFKIRNADFFPNKTSQKIKTVDEFRNYVPVFFFERNRRFYIPNRLDNIIYEIDESGKVVETIPSEFSAAMFYVTNDNTQYTLNIEDGLSVRRAQGKWTKIHGIFITPSFSDDNLIVFRRIGENQFAFSDEKGVMAIPFIYSPGFCDWSFNDRFIFEMCFEELTDIGLKEGLITIKKYDLNTLNLISTNEVFMRCRSCFDIPILLSDKIAIASNFENQKSPVNELFIFGEKSFKKFRLVPPINSKPLNDVAYIGRMPLNFCFALDKSQRKLYSLATTETHVVMMEYEVPNSQ